jgi:hypothetical protein
MRKRPLAAPRSVAETPPKRPSEASFSYLIARWRRKCERLPGSGSKNNVSGKLSDVECWSTVLASTSLTVTMALGRFFEPGADSPTPQQSCCHTQHGNVSSPAIVRSWASPSFSMRAATKS